VTPALATQPPLLSRLTISTPYPQRSTCTVGVPARLPCPSSARARRTATNQDTPTLLSADLPMLADASANTQARPYIHKKFNPGGVGPVDFWWAGAGGPLLCIAALVRGQPSLQEPRSAATPPSDRKRCVSDAVCPDVPGPTCGQALKRSAGEKPSSRTGSGESGGNAGFSAHCSGDRDTHAPVPSGRRLTTGHAQAVGTASNLVPLLGREVRAGSRKRSEGLLLCGRPSGKQVSVHPLCGFAAGRVLAGIRMFHVKHRPDPRVRPGASKPRPRRTLPHRPMHPTPLKPLSVAVRERCPPRRFT
jgi:hypothetical protein